MIEMFCDHCGYLIDENVPGGVRVKTGRREVVFHLCAECQALMRLELKKFINNRPWKETP